MKNICGVVPRILSEDEKEELAAIMKKAAGIIQIAAKRFELSIKSFRIKFFKGELEITDEERQAINTIKGIEITALEGYCRLAYVIARKFYRKDLEAKSGAILDDYLQEGMAAISDAIFSYDGSTKFSTYITWSIRNRLILYVRNDQSLSPVKRRVIKLRAKILKHMNDTQKSFEEAANDLDIDSKDQEECYASLTKAINISDANANWDNNLASYEHVFIDTEFNSKEVLDKSPLSDFERDILIAHLDDIPLVRVVENYKYSRMAGTYALERAKKIVHDYLSDNHIEKAA
jgi:RNA polymerase sigma factor (sigma-70 family)